jgi:hypothetical protein
MKRKRERERERENERERERVLVEAVFRWPLAGDRQRKVIQCDIYRLLKYIAASSSASSPSTSYAYMHACMAWL